MTSIWRRLASAMAAVSIACLPPGSGAAADYVDVTWMSIANLYIHAGPVKAVFDGYITRLPQKAFYGGGGGYAFTTQPFKPDVAAVSRVLQALGGKGEVTLLLTGHSHWDHSFDTATWSRLTGAPIIGSQTTCFEVRAENIPAERCTAVYGREKFDFGEGITLRVIRWNHSGDPAVNWEQHDPVELDGVPRPDPATGGLRAGVAEDFPNGGGNRALLFIADGPQGRLSLFIHDSASPVDLDAPIVLNGVDYGAPIENLKFALADAGLERVDLYIGTGGKAIAERVVPLIRPKAYLPIHWDGLWEPFEAGMPWPFSDPALEAYLTESGVKLLKPAQYMDRWRIGRGGVVPLANTRIKQPLGFPEAQLFAR